MSNKQQILTYMCITANLKCIINFGKPSIYTLSFFYNSFFLFRKLEAKYLELQHNLNEVQLSRSALRKQLHKAMNFAKDMVAEQETLLKALNQRQLENKVVKKIGTEMATKMDTLKSHLKVMRCLGLSFCVLFISFYLSYSLKLVLMPSKTVKRQRKILFLL